jgi:hypothetical protein
MDRRSKTKGVPQEVLTTSFFEEVIKTLPTIWETCPAIHYAPPVSEESPPPVKRKQQLVIEFPKSKFPLPSKTTHFPVSTEEPNHPTPICNLSTPKTPKPKMSPSSQTDELVLAIKKLGKIKSDTGKLHEPEPFTGNDPKKLKAFIF